MENVLEVQQIEERRQSRRSALLMGGAALAGLALAKSATAQASVTDADIFNFALNLEFLEAQFYTLATQGVTIDKLSTNPGTITGVGTAGTVTVKSSPMVPFKTPLLQAYAMETAQDERNHVAFIQKTLGSAAVAMPNIDLMTSFQTLATAAGLPAFDPFADENSFLLGAYVFEDVGVTAYQGAAPLISDSGNLAAALGIHPVEAYHAASIRSRIFALGAPYTTYSQMISTARATLDGSNPPDDIGVSITGSGASAQTTIVDANSMGLTYARTTTQVLNIVYGGKSGGGVFFTNGMNGTIK